MTEIEEAWDELAKRLWNLQLDDQHGLVPNDGWLSSSEKVNDDPGPRTEDALWRRLTDLASLLNYKTLKDDRAYTTNMWACLADISRDLPILRVLFGLRRRALQSQDEQQLDEAVDPDCVLEAARRLLDPTKTNLTPSLRKQALRIVANCCADNNVNRALIIGRNGIDYLKALASSKQELGVLLPTLYNICVDYDVMATGSDEARVRINAMMDEPRKTGDEMMLTVAETLLGKFDDKLGKTSIEVFLTLWQDIDLDQHSVLADVMELASRPATFGVEHVLGTNEPSLVQSRLWNLFDALSLEAQSFEEDAQESVLQTYFNLLTQTAAQEHLARSSDDLESFVVRLYDARHGLTENETFSAAFLKLSYAISSFPAYADANEPGSELIAHLVNLVYNCQSPLAPVFVLLTNSLTSTDRISQFRDLYHLPNSDVSGFVGHPSESTVPALNLCTRLALTRSGQADLFSARYFHVLSKLLRRSRKAKQNLEIDREAIILARLMVKSQHDHAIAILTKDLQLFTAIVDLASATIDASSKLEAGRFVVEVLRTLLARSNINATESTSATNEESTTSDAATQAADSPSMNTPSNASEASLQAQIQLTTRETSNSAIATTMFLITDAPSSAIRAEGLFGLALLSTLPDKKLSDGIIVRLSEQWEKVLPVLNDITAGSGQPDRKAEVENLKFLLSHLLIAQPAEQTETSIEVSNEHSEHGMPEQRGFKEELHRLANQLGLSLGA